VQDLMKATDGCAATLLYSNII